MVDNSYARIVGIKPFWNLIIGYYIYVAHPRRILFDGTQAIAQFFVVGIPAFAIVGTGYAGQGVVLGPPFGIIAVDPQVHEIDLLTGGLSYVFFRVHAHDAV